VSLQQVIRQKTTISFLRVLAGT